MKNYEERCKGCQLSQGLRHPRGNIIVELDGDWILNHYGGNEGFLGWMALQPKLHRMDLTDLTPDEMKALGGNIQRVERALRSYWSFRFESDPIQRVYVVYFFESFFNSPPTEYHLHIHLIPVQKGWVRVNREKKNLRNP